ncbi:MAG: hypothetical protein WCN98_03255, partial [Verrucomicrobiaceae bacterium]
IKVKQLLDAIAPGTTATETPTVIEEAQAVVPSPDAPAAAQVDTSSEQLQALKDLHWLNSEGYVIEYSDGIVFIGVTEPPPAKPKAVKPAAIEGEEKAESVEAVAVTEEAQNPEGTEVTDVEAEEIVVEEEPPTASPS